MADYTRGRIPKGLFQNYDPRPQQGLFRRGGTGLAGLFGMEPWYNQDPFDIAMGFTGSVTPMAKAATTITRHVPLGTSQASRALQKHLFETGQMGKRGWHGSPHSFDEFDDAFIGTGEGAQAYSRGHYFSDWKAPEVAIDYRNRLSPNTIARWEKGGEDARWGGHISDEADRTLSRAFPIIDDDLRRIGGIVDTQQIKNIISKRRDDINANIRGPMKTNNLQVLNDLESAVDKYGLTYNHTPGGHLYEVGLNVDDAVMLHWDKPLSEQPPAVREAIKDFPEAAQSAEEAANVLGERFYKRLGGDQVAATERLRKAGIKGVKYLDQGSRAPGKNELTYNHVIFDPKDTQILKKSAIGASPLASEEPVGK